VVAAAVAVTVTGVSGAQYFFYRRNYWVENGQRENVVRGGEGCMYIRDWFKPIFPSF